MTRACLLLLLAALAAAPAPRPAAAYSYAEVFEEPLLDGREAMFQAAASGFWMAARMTLRSMTQNLAEIDAADPGTSDRFAAAVMAKDPAALHAAFVRAASVEILRRVDHARRRIFDHETATTLLNHANRFRIAVAGDLDPAAARVVAEELPKLIDALGVPHGSGLPFEPADPAAFDAARDRIAKALGREGS